MGSETLPKGSDRQPVWKGKTDVAPAGSPVGQTPGQVDIDKTVKEEAARRAKLREEGRAARAQEAATAPKPESVEPATKETEEKAAGGGVKGAAEKVKGAAEVGAEVLKVVTVAKAVIKEVSPFLTGLFVGHELEEAKSFHAVRPQVAETLRQLGEQDIDKRNQTVGKLLAESRPFEEINRDIIETMKVKDKGGRDAQLAKLQEERGILEVAANAIGLFGEADRSSGVKYIVDDEEQRFFKVRSGVMTESEMDQQRQVDGVRKAGERIMSEEAAVKNLSGYNSKMEGMVTEYWNVANKNWEWAWAVAGVEGTTEEGRTKDEINARGWGSIPGKELINRASHWKEVGEEAKAERANQRKLELLRAQTGRPGSGRGEDEEGLIAYIRAQAEAQRLIEAERLGMNQAEYALIVKGGQQSLVSWLEREMSRLEVAGTEYERTRATNRINYAVNLIQALRSEEMLEGDKEKRTLAAALTERWVDRVVFEEAFASFDAAGKDESKGFEGATDRLASYCEKMFKGKEGEKRMTRMWRENLPTVLAMEEDKERLRAWLDSKSAEEDDKIIKYITYHEIATPEERQSQEGLLMAEGRTRRGIKWWRFMGRQALFDAYMPPIETDKDGHSMLVTGSGRGIRRHGVEDKKLAQQLNGILYAEKTHKAGNKAVQQVMDTEIRDFVSYMFSDELLKELGLERDDHYRVKNLAAGNKEAMEKLDFSNLDFEKPGMKGQVKSQEMFKKWFENLGFAVDTYGKLIEWSKKMDAETARSAANAFVNLFEAPWNEDKDSWNAVPLGSGEAPSWQKGGFANRRHVKIYQIIEMTYKMRLSMPEERARMVDSDAELRLARDLATTITADGGDKRINNLMLEHLLSEVHNPGVGRAVGIGLSALKGIFGGGR